ncbi:metal ABC transporter permease [Corynebacterium glyciniphilum]|uniref:metal ABC transporter permease n=1 Tax=Corynebacterium glyciniphilum TaxID=1404244 RepID=UPI0021B3772F|nr:metal ABC transporter permease [Corynebacterium glyciniphilum]
MSLENLIGPADFLSNHTYRMVFLGTMAIGLVAGALGSFAYLRKQSLISDVISHAALPGTLLAFLVSVVILGTDGRNMIALIIGAVIIGTIAVLLANGISRATKIRIDTAMAISLTVFFGAGMLLMRIISDGTYPGKGGIQDYLFGNASVITRADLITSIVVGAVALILTAVFWKEFALRTFDPQHSTVLGFRAGVIDTLMFTTIVIATVIGVKAVGLVLMVAFVVTPPAAARQWTRRLPSMVVLSALIGATGSGLGAYLSIALGGVPTGPLIVLTLFGIFVLSLLLSPRRSIVTHMVSRYRARRDLKRELEVAP